MKKLSESVWMDIHKQSTGNTERKEDIINSNVKDMVPVDTGCSVLWADRDLEIDGENKFIIDDIKNYEPDGWRRPTREEADELMRNAKWDTDKGTGKPFSDYSIFINHSGSKSLVFHCDFGKYSEYWIRENHDQAGYWSTFDFKADGAFFPHSAHSMAKLSDKCRVRFVREK